MKVEEGASEELGPLAVSLRPAVFHKVVVVVAAGTFIAIVHGALGSEEPAVRWGLTGLFAIVAAGFLLVLPWGRIFLHDNGVRWTTLWSPMESRRLWTDVETAWHEEVRTTYLVLPIPIPIPGGARTSLQLEFAGGGALKISNAWNGAKKAVDAILERVQPILRARAEEALARSGTVSFGPVSLDAQGVRWRALIGTREAKWSEIAAAEIKRGELLIRRKGEILESARIELRRIPNWSALLAILDERIRGARIPAAGSSSSDSDALQFLESMAKSMPTGGAGCLVALLLIGLIGTAPVWFSTTRTWGWIVGASVVGILVGLLVGGSGNLAAKRHWIATTVAPRAREQNMEFARLVAVLKSLNPEDETLSDRLRDLARDVNLFDRASDEVGK